MRTLRARASVYKWGRHKYSVYKSTVTPLKASLRTVISMLRSWEKLWQSQRDPGNILGFWLGPLKGLFPGGSVKRLPTMWETQVQSLGQEDLLEKEMATHSSTLAWKIPWMVEPGRLQSTGRKESDTTERIHFTSLWKVTPVGRANHKRTNSTLTKVQLWLKRG